MLTEIQKYRVLYHLDMSFDTAYAEVTAEFKLQLDNLQPAKFLALIGNVDTATPDRIYEFQGVAICTTDSILGNCERCLDLMSPDTIEVTQYVSATEEITLRGNEQAKRDSLYQYWRSRMFQLFDIKGEGSQSDSYGYSW